MKYSARDWSSNLYIFSTSLISERDIKGQTSLVSVLKQKIWLGTVLIFVRIILQISHHNNLDILQS